MFNFYPRHTPGNRYSLCTKTVVKDPCILAVLQGWDAVKAEPVITPSPTKAVIWEEFVAPTIPPAVPLAEVVTPSSTTSTTTTTTTTSSSKDVAWWRKAVTHLPRLLRHFQTMTTTTTTTSSPEQRGDSARFPANNVDDAQPLVGNAQPPVDDMARYAELPVDDVAREQIISAPSSIIDDAHDARLPAGDVEPLVDHAAQAPIISAPSSVIGADEHPDDNDADIGVETVPKSIQIEPILIKDPPTIVIVTPMAIEDALPDVKVVPMIVVDPLPVIEVEPVAVAEEPQPADDALLLPPAESAIISTPSSIIHADENSPAIISAPSSNVDTRDPPPSNSTANIEPSTTSTTTSSSFAVNKVSTTPSTSNSIDNVPLKAPPVVTSPRSPRNMPPTTTMRASTSKILDAIRPAAKPEVRADSASSPTPSSTLTASLDSIVTGW